MNGPQHLGRRRPGAAVPWACLLLLGLALPGSMVAAAPDTTVALQATGTNSEGLSTYELSWDATAHALYKIQSRSSFSPGVPWTTEDLIKSPTAGRIAVTLLNPPVVSDNGFSSPAAKFYRVELPTTEIFRIEPSVISGSGGEIFVLGQCFTATHSVRVDGVNAITELVDAGTLRVTLGILTDGSHRIEVIDNASGQIVASLPIGLQSVSAPFLTLPPERPPAQGRPDLTNKISASHFSTDQFSAEHAPRAGAAQYVALPTGEFILAEEDLRIPGRGFDLVWTRTYRSRTGIDTAQGQGWDFSYNIRVQPSGQDVELYDGNGRRYTLRLQANGTFAADGLFREGSNSNGAFRVQFSDASLWSFYAWNDPLLGGRLRQIIDRRGNTMDFLYDAQARLADIIDTLGRTNRLAYGADGRIASLTDFSGRQVRYAYYGQGEQGGSPGDLQSVTSPAVIGTPNANDFPNGKTTAYTYSKEFQDDRLNHNLLSITDPKGQTWLQIEYHSALSANLPDFDAVAAMQRGANKKMIHREILTPPSGEKGYTVVRTFVNDYVGNVGEYDYDSRNRLVAHRANTGRAIPNLPTTEIDNRPTGKLRASDPNSFETRYEWNADSLLTRLIRPRGNVAERIYERDFDNNATARSKGNLRIERKVPCCGGTDVVTIRHEHDARFGSEGGADFATKTTDPRAQVTLRGYDEQGNLLKVQHPLPGAVEEFEYNPFGQMTAQVFPLDNDGCRRRDTFEYYSEPGTAGFGYLKKQTKDDGSAPCGQTGHFRLATSYEYDAAGNITAIIDPRGTTNRFRFNALNQIVLRTRACASIEGAPAFELSEDFTYDANDNLLVSRTENRDETGALNPTNSYFRDALEYDALNRCTRRSRGGDAGNPGVTTEYSHDGNGAVVQIRQPEAVNGTDPHNVVQWEYDERNLLFRRVRAPLSPLRSTNQWDYDANANRTIQKDWDAINGFARVTRCAYDGLDRLESILDPLGNSVTNRYDLNGNLVWRRWDGNYSGEQQPGSGAGRLAESRLQYDPLNHAILCVEAFFDPVTQAPLGDGGRTTQIAYAPDGQATSLTDDNGHTTRYFYDSASRLFKVQDPKTNTVIYTYDGNNNVTTVTQVDRSDIAEDPQTFVTRFDYDSLNRLGRIMDNMTNTTRYAYDSRDNLVRLFDARGGLTRHEYDGLNRLIRTGHDLNADLNPFGDGDIVTRQAWDANSRLRSQTDDNLNATQYAYDSLDRLARTTLADGTTETNAYDAHDNLVFKRDANGTAMNNTYDLLNRLVARSILPGVDVAPDTSAEVYQYDGLSRMVRAQDNDSVVTREFDSLGNLQREGVNGLATSYTYDGVGNRLSLEFPGGRLATYAYDSLNQVKVVRDNTGGVNTDLATYHYIGPHRVTRRDNGNGIRSRFNYDGVQGVPNATNDFGVQRLSRVRHSTPGAATVIDERTFAYDRNQNQNARADTRPGGSGFKHSYYYDAANRLTLAEVRDSFSLVRSSPYPLDGVGNRVPEQAGFLPWTRSSAMPDPGDYQMNQYTTTDFDVRSYDGNGNTLATILTLHWLWLPSRLITYDYRNQIVGITDPFTGAAASYTYDALGRRLRKTRVPAAFEPSITTDFAYDHRSVIEERQKGTVTASFYRVPQGHDEVLCMFRGTHRYFYHHDELGSVMALSDENGALAERYDYLEYGQPEFYDGQGNPWLSSQVENPLLFHGQRYDDESGFYHGGAGYLDSQVGRFATRDPKGAWNDPLALGNAFTYAGNNPWTFSDSRGLPSYAPPELGPSTKVTVRGWDPKKKELRIGHPPSLIPNSGISDPPAGSAPWLKTRHDTVKNSIGNIR